MNSFNNNPLIVDIESCLFRISILNSLCKVDVEDLDSFFMDLVVSYPEVVSILPHILFICMLDETQELSYPEYGYYEYNFNKNEFNPVDILDFVKSTNLLNLLHKTKDLYSYLKGMCIVLNK